MAKVLSKSDPSFATVMEWTELHRDEDGVNPLTDWDQPFEVFSNIPRELGGSKNAHNPFDDEGELEEGVYAFPVSAYIHSGICLSLARSFASDPGGWDTTRGALIVYTNKDIYEKCCGPWMQINGNAVDEEAFRDHLYKMAACLVDELNMALDGSCYGYTTHKRIPYTKTYADGRTVEGFDIEDGRDSCWGFLTDDVNDIDFPRNIPCFADDDTYLAGKEYKA